MAPPRTHTSQTVGRALKHHPLSRAGSKKKEAERKHGEKHTQDRTTLCYFSFVIFIIQTCAPPQVCWRRGCGGNDYAARVFWQEWVWCSSPSVRGRAAHHLQAMATIHPARRSTTTMRVTCGRGEHPALLASNVAPIDELGGVPN